MPPRDDPACESSPLLGKDEEWSDYDGGNNATGRRHSKMKVYSVLNLALFVCSLIFLGITLRLDDRRDSSSTLKNSNQGPTTNSRYSKVQGIGFQIYTGGAPAFLKANNSNNNATTKQKLKPNPECKGLARYGSMWTDDGYEIQCYVGHQDPEQDVQARLRIMKDAVEEAYTHADPDRATLKVFLAPEFFWRGMDGAYMFQQEEPGDDSICGPVCQILMGLEDYIADKRFEDWLFLFGSITAYESAADRGDPYEYLFYNFAPIYRGYDPQTSSFEGKRFIAPKRYLSTSDFITTQRHLNSSAYKELTGQQSMFLHQQQQQDKSSLVNDTTVSNPSFTREKYDYDVWIEYRHELDRFGYTMLEYGWLMIDGLSVSIEICLDHQLRKSLTAYLADASTGRRTLIPSTSDQGLEYVPIPQYQAQLGLVSSAGMTVVTDSLALTNNGILFLQDGLSNATNRLYWGEIGCEFGVQLEGGTEAVQRESFVSSTDISFEHKALEAFQRLNLYPESSWQGEIQGSFSTKVYPPQLTVFDAMDIAKVAN